MTRFVSIDGYVIKRITERAIGIRKENDQDADLIWVPKSQVEDADVLDVGDIDICVADWIVEREELDV